VLKKNSDMTRKDRRLIHHHHQFIIIINIYSAPITNEL